MDPVKAVLYIGALSLGIGLLAALYIVWQNSQSRNLVLGVGALGGAVLVFTIQVYFELNRFRDAVTYDRVSTSITIDRATPLIRQWIYPMPTAPSFLSGSRIHLEVGASDWLVSNAPKLFQEDSGQLATDLIMFSLVAFLASAEFDWQLRMNIYESSSSGVIVMTERVSPESDCTVLKIEDAMSQLSYAHNVFADVPMDRRPVCLPPRSTLKISRNSLVITNPICKLSFNVTSPPSEYYVKPGSGSVAPVLPNGKPQFTTRWVGIAIETALSPFRSQHGDVGRYREWARRVVTDAGAWFK